MHGLVFVHRFFCRAPRHPTDDVPAKGRSRFFSWVSRSGGSKAFGPPLHLVESPDPTRWCSFVLPAMSMSAHLRPSSPGLHICNKRCKTCGASVLRFHSTTEPGKTRIRTISRNNDHTMIRFTMMAPVGATCPNSLWLPVYWNKGHAATSSLPHLSNIMLDKHRPLYLNQRHPIGSSCAELDLSLDEER